MQRPAGTALMDRLAALCKRRGFIFGSSEIYGGLNGFWDFGPLGALLKNNLRDRWWRDMVLEPPDGPDGRPLTILGLDCAIISHPKVWEASGHVAGFADPMQTCRQCKRLFRADQVEELCRESPWYSAFQELLLPVKEGVTGAEDRLLEWARSRKAPEGIRRDPQSGLARLRLHNPLPCPECGGDLTEPRQFNLMFETYYGAVRDEEHRTYLRPETAQGMFYNFKNVLDTSRVKVPFGLAQLGKGFRNEITPRNYIFRSREFEMMEVEFFVHPSQANDWYQFWRKARYDWWCRLGLAGKNLRLRDHEKDELAHYARDAGGCCDVEYAFPFSGEKGFSELEGIAYRSNFDLTQHEKVSGARLEYFDDEKKEHYLPHVIEPAAGLTRGLLAVLCEAYDVDESRPSPELMRFHPSLSPIKCGVFPLVNKDGLPEIALGIYAEVRRKVGTSQYDEKQSIGKRYARMDEAGTPFCITVDGQTKEDGTVTVRDRDTGLQVRVATDQVVAYLKDKLAIA